MCGSLRVNDAALEEPRRGVLGNLLSGSGEMNLLYIFNAIEIYFFFFHSFEMFVKHHLMVLEEASRPAYLMTLKVA